MTRVDTALLSLHHLYENFIRIESALKVNTIETI